MISVQYIFHIFKLLTRIKDVLGNHFNNNARVIEDQCFMNNYNTQFSVNEGECTII